MIIQVIGILLFLLGFIIITIGIVLSKKQKINWVSVHSKVKKKDTPIFTKMIGLSTIGVGISVELWGLFWVIHQLLMGLILFGIAFVISMVFYFRTQKLYD
jgi:uncharacterized membrane protein